MYEEGDVLWGLFPRADKGRGAHPALVVAKLGPAYIAIVGTSKGVALASVDAQLVVSPWCTPARTWAATGLKEATGFDFARGRWVVLTDSPRYGEALIGSVIDDSIWRRDLRMRIPVLARRIQKDQEGR